MTAKHTKTEEQQSHARRLGLVGLLAHWNEVPADVRDNLLQWEADQRQANSLARRTAHARLGSFRPYADIDWSDRHGIDRDSADELMQLDFVRTGSNVILRGPAGTGKTMLAKNLGQRALLAGYRVRMVTAAHLLSDLARPIAPEQRKQRLHGYLAPDVLIVDEVGLVAYDDRAADLLYTVVAGRYQRKSIVLATTRPFEQWHDVFPTAACVDTIVDRLTHHATLLACDGPSYRQREAQERSNATGSRRR